MKNAACEHRNVLYEVYGVTLYAANIEIESQRLDFTCVQ